MNYEKFLELIIHELEEKLEDGLHFSHTTVEKVNGISLHALVISNPKVNISPAIYLDLFFKRYQNGELTLSQIIEEITDLYSKGAFEQDIDVTMFTDYSKVKTNLGLRLVNTAESQNLLAQVPHREILDLSLIYVIYPDCAKSDETWSIQVTHPYLKAWNVTEEDLYQQAMENMKKESVLISLEEHLQQQLGTTEEILPKVDSLYLLTNERKIYGAVQMLNENVLKSVADLFKEDFYILPSSVHEVLLLSVASEFANAKELAQMVHEINCTELAVGEILSDHVYHYDSKIGKITIVA